MTRRLVTVVLLMLMGTLSFVTPAVIAEDGRQALPFRVSLVDEQGSAVQARLSIHEMFTGGLVANSQSGEVDIAPDSSRAMRMVVRGSDIAPMDTTPFVLASNGSLNFSNDSFLPCVDTGLVLQCNLTVTTGEFPLNLTDADGIGVVVMDDRARELQRFEATDQYYINTTLTVDHGLLLLQHNESGHLLNWTSDSTQNLAEVLAAATVSEIHLPLDAHWAAVHEPSGVIVDFGEGGMNLTGPSAEWGSWNIGTIEEGAEWPTMNDTYGPGLSTSTSMWLDVSLQRNATSHLHASWDWNTSITATDSLLWLPQPWLGRESQLDRWHGDGDGTTDPEEAAALIQWVQGLDIASPQPPFLSFEFSRSSPSTQNNSSMSWSALIVDGVWKLESSGEVTSVSASPFTSFGVVLLDGAAIQFEVSTSADIVITSWFPLVHSSRTGHVLNLLLTDEAQLNIRTNRAPTFEIEVDGRTDGPIRRAELTVNAGSIDDEYPEDLTCVHRFSAAQNSPFIAQNSTIEATIDLNSNLWQSIDNLTVNSTCTDPSGAMANRTSSYFIDDTPPEYVAYLTLLGLVETDPDVRLDVNETSFEVFPTQILAMMVNATDDQGEYYVRWWSDRSGGWETELDVSQVSFLQDNHVNGLSDPLEDRYLAKTPSEYTLLLEVSDVAGNVVFDEWTFIVIDGDAPTIRLRGESNGQYATHPSNETLHLDLTESFDDLDAIDDIIWSITLSDCLLVQDSVLVTTGESLDFDTLSRLNLGRPDEWLTDSCLGKKDGRVPYGAGNRWLNATATDSSGNSFTRAIELRIPPPMRPDYSVLSHDVRVTGEVARVYVVVSNSGGTAESLVLGYGTRYGSVFEGKAADGILDAVVHINETFEVSSSGTPTWFNVSVTDSQGNILDVLTVDLNVPVSSSSEEDDDGWLAGPSIQFGLITIALAAAVSGRRHRD